MANKITKREVINTMLADVNVKANATYVAYLENELALLDKKSANKKETKTQVENVGIKETILEVLGTMDKATVTEIQSKSAELGALSNQKVSALVRQLMADGLVDKVVDKKKSYFFLVSED